MIFPFEVRFLRPGYGPERGRYFYQKKFINFEDHIKKGDRVLDIGSGQHPFPLATHLADLYEKETSHRAGKLIKDKRPFILCDIENMPFKNKEFDFIYCSHVLEHTQDPGRACREIMRVGKKGYIETPTRTSDILFNIGRGKNHHRWHIVKINNGLVFFECSKEEERDLNWNYFSEQFHFYFKNPIQDFVYQNRDFFCNMFLWENKFNYYIFDKKGKLIN